MERFGDLYQTADWKTEKHVPVIDCPERVSAGQIFKVQVEIGKDIPHPNTTEHHIQWIRVYFHPEGEKYPYEIGNYEFSAHGASAKGPNTSGVYTHHAVVGYMKTDRPGTLVATASCNIHGLWVYQFELQVDGVPAMAQGQAAGEITRGQNPRHGLSPPGEGDSEPSSEKMGQRGSQPRHCAEYTNAGGFP